jgi:hypothetical protein
MKLSLVSALVAAAALVPAGASPIRLDTVNHPGDAPAGIRFGYALGGNNPTIGSHHVATVVRNDGSAFSTRPRGPCKGMRSRFSQKAADLSSAFREALGLSPNAPISVSEHGPYHIMPFPPPSFVAIDHEVGTPPHHRPHHHHGHHGHHRHGGHLYEASFFRRLHIALMTLGPWEGRAFAFVLGCGIGVLLRMFWVLAVVGFRMFKGTNPNTNNEYTQIFVVEELEAVPEPAPAYAYPAEKTEAVVVAADDAKN